MFLVCIFLIGFILFSGVNTDIMIKLEGGKTIVSKIPPNFPIGTTVFLIILSAVAGWAGFYYISDLSKKLSITKKQHFTVQMLEGDVKRMYLYILEKEQCLQKDLVYELKLPKAKVTRILDKLDQKGLVKRISYGKTNRIVPT